MPANVLPAAWRFSTAWSQNPSKRAIMSFSDEAKRLTKERRRLMKYLCMVIVDEKKLHALSESELQALDDESLAYDKNLREGGHFIAAQALESVQAATTVHVRGGKVVLTD